MSQRLRWLGLAALFGPSLVLSGCFVYVPVEGPPPPAGEQVRVLVHPEAARRLAAESGRRVDRVDGRLVELNSDSVTVSVWVGPEYRGTTFERMRRPLTLAEPDVLEIQLRQLSRQRTFVSALGAAAAVGFLLNHLLGSTGGAEGTLPPPPAGPTPSMVPR